MLVFLENSQDKFNTVLEDRTNTDSQNILSTYSSIKSDLLNNDLASANSQINILENKLLEFMETQIQDEKLPVDIENYFSTIKILLTDAVNEIKENNDYRKADKNVISAYLDNYEYLEAPY